MILVILGSQKFQFNRLLKKIDELIEKEEINTEVFAQIGYSDYTPKNYKYERFLDKNKFAEAIDKSKIVITHAGTGSIIESIKKDKKVIAVARLSKYGEHVDDHQIDIINQFNNMNLIKGIIDINDLSNSLHDIDECKFNKYQSNTKNIVNIIEEFISIN